MRLERLLAERLSLGAELQPAAIAANNKVTKRNVMSGIIRRWPREARVRTSSRSRYLPKLCAVGVRWYAAENTPWCRVLRGPRANGFTERSFEDESFARRRLDGSPNRPSASIRRRAHAVEEGPQPQPLHATTWQRSADRARVFRRSLRCGRRHCRGADHRVAHGGRRLSSLRRQASAAHRGPYRRHTKSWTTQARTSSWRPLASTSSSTTRWECRRRLDLGRCDDAQGAPQI